MSGEKTSAVETGLPSLKIPSQYRYGVARIGHLSDASFTDFFAALKKSSEASTAAKLAAKIFAGTRSINRDDLRQIVGSVAEMQSIQSTAHVDTETFVSDIWDALESDSPEYCEGLDDKTFKKRVTQLLSETPIYLPAAKVAEVRSEVERLFCGARILTDVRPAFREDATKRPAMTIMHGLEIRFHDDMGRHREFYVNLDDDDLATLKHAIERAMLKKETLTKLLQEANFELYG
jgi:hypothetical protein